MVVVLTGSSEILKCAQVTGRLEKKKEKGKNLVAKRLKRNTTVHCTFYDGVYGALDGISV